MSEKNEKDPKNEKKRLKLTKEVVESLTDEDLDKATGGGDRWPGGSLIWNGEIQT